MFRFNSKGHFNVCYGGMGYNTNTLENKIKYISSKPLQDRLKKTTIECKDFSDFFKNKDINKNDFIFLDPPYDSEFNTYDENKFTLGDHQILSKFLIHNLKCNWMLIIKHTPFIYQLYNKKKLRIQFYDKNYKVSLIERNERQTQHLIITNY